MTIYKNIETIKSVDVSVFCLLNNQKDDEYQIILKVYKVYKCKKIKYDEIHMEKIILKEKEWAIKSV